MFDLVSSLRDQDCDLLVVVNSDAVDGIQHIELPNGIECVVRTNTGMNIGSWDCAFKLYPTYNYYIFLQDECILNNHELFPDYLNKLEYKNIGMIGDSTNPKWNQSWDDISKTQINYIVGKDELGNSISRVDYYQAKMRGWGISPGLTGNHLRALSWAFAGDTLHKINGFPIGNSKEECIAAEISVSKSVEQLGLSIQQAHSHPFHFFRHSEWRLDGMGKI